MQKRVRTRRVERSKNGAALPLLLLLALPVAFWLGRKSVPDPPPPPEPVACEPKSVCTSTAGLCPCPPPKKPRAPRREKIQVLPIPKKQSPPVETAPFERDPTEPTAAYLRAHAADLSACAPKTGARIRIHLEVQVSPAGAIERVKITNLEPPPGEIASCVDRMVRALTPPGFDGSASEVFALTVVL
jgi:hypothetical protein